ncbi:MAG TPA: adenylate/guanylate cyclase domain-containing protein [Thermoleophilaceae bacterium]
MASDDRPPDAAGPEEEAGDRQSPEDEGDGEPSSEERDGEGRPLPVEALGKLRRTDGSPRLLRAARMLRDMLPGDSQLGDPLSTAGEEPSLLIARRVAEVGAERPSAIRELGLGALQVWQALSEAQGRGRGDRELAIVFTDLVDFSSWALDAGDEATLELLRRVGRAQESAISAREGRVVKRLGDGLMAVFGEPQDAVEAAHDARRGVAEVELDGYRPKLRAGVHVGRPRKIGGDYVGVDVNVAARVADGASGDQVLVSGAIRDRLDPAAFDCRRLRRFKAKGVPKELEVYRAEPA